MIVTAAAEIFAKKGYRATSLDEVADKLGVKKASCYHYISSKEDILMDIFDQYYALCDKHLRSVSEDTSVPPNERLRRMVHSYVNVMTEDTNIIGSLVRAESELSPDNQKIVLRKNRELERIFERVVIEGQQSGVIRNVTPRLIALAIIGMIEFMVQWYSLAGWPLPAEKVGAEFALLLETGWLFDGTDRAGAWPRAESVGEALKEPLQKIAQLRSDLDSLESSLKQVETQLEDGLATDQRAARSIS
ncbi:TetR family transcriptional regulator [Ensifer sp. NBAIM29]|nr:TetR family transcriptional regulator [Ensifer sp. NBAIM29]